MPITSTRPGVSPSPVEQWVGWGIYATIALIGFCFGVWVGNQRPGPAVETAQLNSKTELQPAPDKTGKSPDTPEKSPKKGIDSTPPMPKKDPPEDKTPEPKMVEDKKAPDPEPVPKKTEPTPPSVPSVLFAKDIQPIFKAKCTLCHGDTKSLKGGLDLRTLASIEKGGDSGKALVAGDLEKSSIWDWVEVDQMPPPEAKNPLTPEEKTLIKNWILGDGK